MPTYKLLYFNLRGIGELVRLIFKQAGVDFEDFRFSRDEDWHKYIDGKTVWFVNFSDSVQCILFSNYVRMNVWIHIRWSNRDCYLLLCTMSDNVNQIFQSAKWRSTHTSQCDYCAGHCRPCQTQQKRNTK